MGQYLGGIEDQRWSLATEFWLLENLQSAFLLHFASIETVDNTPSLPPLAAVFLRCGGKTLHGGNLAINSHTLNDHLYESLLQHNLTDPDSKDQRFIHI